MFDVNQSYGEYNSYRTQHIKARATKCNNLRSLDSAVANSGLDFRRRYSSNANAGQTYMRVLRDSSVAGVGRQENRVRRSETGSRLGCAVEVLAGNLQPNGKLLSSSRREVKEYRMQKCKSAREDEGFKGNEKLLGGLGEAKVEYSYIRVVINVPLLGLQLPGTLHHSFIRLFSQKLALALAFADQDNGTLQNHAST